MLREPSLHIVVIKVTFVARTLWSSSYICTTTFYIQKFEIMPTNCIYVYYMVLRTNNDYIRVQHK